eukprot:7130269-Prymnesium_polylepis.1
MQHAQQHATCNMHMRMPRLRVVRVSSRARTLTLCSTPSVRTQREARRRVPRPPSLAGRPPRQPQERRPLADAARLVNVHLWAGRQPAVRAANARALSDRSHCAHTHVHVHVHVHTHATHVDGAVPANARARSTVHTVLSLPKTLQRSEQRAAIGALVWLPALNGRAVTRAPPCPPNSRDTGAPFAPPNSRATGAPFAPPTLEACARDRTVCRARLSLRRSHCAERRCPPRRVQVEARHPGGEAAIGQGGRQHRRGGGAHLDHRVGVRLDGVMALSDWLLDCLIGGGAHLDHRVGVRFDGVTAL